MLKNMLFLLGIGSVTLPILSQHSTRDQLENHVSFLASDSMLGRGFGTQQGVRAAQYIADRFKEAGIEPLKGSYFHHFNYRTGTLNISGTNVVGVIRGSDPGLREEYILLGAHYDHVGWKYSEGDTLVYNGADDNASGTAAIIEAGRILAAQKGSLGRSIILAAFDGEETGLIGSRYFLQDTLVPPHRIRLMFSLDMVGMLEAHGGLELNGVKMLSDYESLVGPLAEAHGLVITRSNKRIVQRTDTAPFGAIGIPAINATTGTESPYHKPEDDAPALDYEGMAGITGFISDATHQLSSVENLSPNQGPGEDGVIPDGEKVFTPGFVLGAGSGNHDYNAAFYKGKSILSAEAGLFASIRATRFLAIQPEVLYGTRGSRHPDGKFRTHSLTTPLYLRISSQESEMVSTYFLLGGYYSYHFGGKAGGTDIDFQDEYTRHEFGLGFGFGMQVMNVRLAISVRNGLSSLLQDPAAGRVTSEGVSFSLGFLF